jgi:glycosyltransferase involved in cell wall biosynthesis
MRVLFIARYRDASMDRKPQLLAAAGVNVRQVRPARWEDPLLRVTQTAHSEPNLAQAAVPLLGRPDDPHRAVYRTLDFGARRFRPDLIHAEEEPDSLAALQVALARRLFAPRAALLLYTWQNVDRRRRPEVEWVLARSLRAADGILCANREAETILRRRGYRGLTRVLPAIGVDGAVFRPGPAQPARDGLVVGYAGRLTPEKGLEVLLEAAALCGAAIQVSLMGDGPARPVLEAQAHALGLAGRVQFRPPAPPAQVAEFLRGLEVLVLPSRATPVWKEQFGRVLAEAMACGVPVVGAESGAIPEVIGEAGLTFPEGDAAALAERLLALQRSPGLRRELAERGRTRAVERFCVERITAATLEVYRQIRAESR